MEENRMMQDLHSLLQKVQQRLREGRYQNKSDVREAIVVPLLEAVGWETTDPGVVQREYSIGQTRVSYALFAEPSTPALLIEAKAVNSSREDSQQPFQDLFQPGFPG